MKKNPHIIDVRHQLPWKKRYISNTTTFLLWGAWLVLWQPIMNEMGLLETQSDRLVDQILNAFFRILEHGFVALLICAVMLWLWSRFIPAKTAIHSEKFDLDDYSDAFHISSNDLQRARQQKIVMVHHDQFGKILKIE